MLVPARDVALSLRAARAPHDARLVVARRTCELTDRELDRLCETVLGALGKEALTVDELVAQIGARAIRSLGEPGKKLGFATTLPIALAELQVCGEVQRVSTEGRLDTQRFRYRVSRKRLSAPAPTEQEVHLDLARRFFDWAAPATRDELAFWLGVGKKQAGTIIDALGLIAWGDRFIWRESARMDKPRVTRLLLLPFRDNLFAFRRGIGVFVDDPGIALLDWGKGTTTAGKAASLHQHAIVDGGRLIGVWDWDRKVQKIAWAMFAKRSATELRALEAVIEQTQDLVRRDLADVRFYSLDNEGNRKRRLSFIRSLSTKRA
jgi:hypothetical protein